MLNSLAPLLFEKTTIAWKRDDSGKPWFYAKDVFEALGYKSLRSVSTLLVNLPEEWRLQNSILQSQDGLEGHWVSEEGLYQILGRSRKPKARPFQRWLFGEVVPQIRKTGQYIANTDQNLLLTVEQKFNLSKQLADTLVDKLRMSHTSALRMYKDLGLEFGLPLKFFPSYSDERLARAATSLLAAHGVGISTIAFNRELIAHGFLEELERPGSHSSIRKFKSITEKGEYYGKNETSPENPRETQPLWFVDTFPELLAAINLEVPCE